MCITGNCDHAYRSNNIAGVETSAIVNNANEKAVINQTRSIYKDP